MIYFDKPHHTLYKDDIICEKHIARNLNYRNGWKATFEWRRIINQAKGGMWSEDITDEVEKWMKLNKIKYPFTKEEKTLFTLTFG